MIRAFKLFSLIILTLGGIYRQWSSQSIERQSASRCWNLNDQQKEANDETPLLMVLLMTECDVVQDRLEVLIWMKG